MPSSFRGYSYQAFAEASQFERRHLLTSVQRGFLDAVLASVGPREAVIEVATTLFRAQVGFDFAPYSPRGNYVGHMRAPYALERMVPLIGRAREGRVNAKGIPCLYLASDQETAIAEVRPWTKAFVSVASFEIANPLRIVDCAKRAHRRRGVQIQLGPRSQTDEELEETAWDAINRAYSIPTTPSDDEAEYAPTQIIAEFFREHGYDGVRYRSGLGKGQNIALFDLTSASLRDCRLWVVQAVTYQSRLEGSPLDYALRQSTATDQE